MADKPLKPCKQQGCAELTRAGYCDKHKPDWRAKEHKSSNEWRWLYRTKEWRSLREMKLLTSPFCSECAKHGVRARATDVDHISPHKGNRALFGDKDNLQSLCHRCHSRKTMHELRGTLSGK